MRHNKLTVGLFIFAGVLYVIGGLRDVFAPGFFNMSPQIPSNTDIVIKFVLAGAFLGLAFVFSRTQAVTGKSKK
jgi:hypothetical protein